MKRWEINDAEDKISPEAIAKSATNLIPKNAILIVNRSGILKHTLPVGITRRPVAINQDIKALICADAAHPDYIAHMVKAAEPVVLRWVRATTADNFSIDNLRDLEIPLPPLDEQRRIAAILDKADALRRKRQRALDLLDGLTQSIFLEMFGDPITNAKRLDSRPLGELNVDMSYGPRFYNEKGGRAAAQAPTRARPARRPDSIFLDSEDGIRIVRITDLSSSGHLRYGNMPKISLPLEEIDKHKSQPGDILFARTGATVGKIALIDEECPPNIPGAYFIRLRFPDCINPVFASYALRTGAIQQIISEGSRQSAQQNFSGPGLRRLPFIVPKLDDQKKFAKQVDGARRMLLELERSAQTLESLFASLQFRAFSGQL